MAQDYVTPHFYCAHLLIKDKPHKTIEIYSDSHNAYILHACVYCANELTKQISGIEK